MTTSSWLFELDQARLDYTVLGGLALLALSACLLVRVGLVHWAMRLLGDAVRRCIRLGFQLWEPLLSWASWPAFLALALALLLAGGLAAPHLPGLTIVCALVALGMGLLACLAYTFIDLERYEVARGYKAIHNPLKGQELARNLVRYGPRVGVALLGSAAVALVGGFALLNQGLYQSVGRAWYSVGEGGGTPDFLDFLVNVLLHLLRVVDVLDLASSHNLVRATYVRQAAWPALALLGAFKTLFTLVLLQQIFASVRQGQSLAETIADFWSPHEPIHERARSSLPHYGPGAVGPLLVSLRATASLTPEQREQLPLILAGIGPAALPALVRHLGDPHEHVRAVAVATLGHLHARDAAPLLVPLARDRGDLVRQAVAEALGEIAVAGPAPARTRRKLRRLAAAAGPRMNWLLWGRPRAPAAPADPTALAVGTLRAALDDTSVAVRIRAAVSLGRVGSAAAAARPRLVALLSEGDEALRCAAAEALGQLGAGGPAVAALAALLTDASAPVRGAAARALGGLKEVASPAVAALAALLQDSEESVRTAAAEAIAGIGTLGEDATDAVVAGLSDRDNVVRARAAEALGAIGAPAQEAAPALVEVLKDENDVVRARAVEALGKIGDAVAGVAVPGLVRALRDPDNWVSALAAEALGHMGESADGAVPALVRALGHVNPLVRANAAEALGSMGAAAGRARAALEKACADEDGAVRDQALRALGALGAPTPAAEAAARAGLQDADPRVRAAAVAALGDWGGAGGVTAGALVALLADGSDQVKVEAARVLPRLGGAGPEVVAGLCRRLEEDDSPLVQEHAARALGKLGPTAAAAGEALIRVAQTAEAGVREEALRALAIIQPPGAAAGFAAGLRDASGDVRKVASAGWLKATAIPEEAIPELVQALGDPETQVRANAVHALSRLEAVPSAAVPRLAECAADPSDGLRIGAALALQAAPPAEAREVLEGLLADPNVRVRLIAAGSLLGADPDNDWAGAVVLGALADPAPRVRKSALALVESLGAKGRTLAETARRRGGWEDDPEAAADLARLIDHLSAPPEAVMP
jgi:HEAT repeat protein